MGITFLLRELLLMETGKRGKEQPLLLLHLPNRGHPVWVTQEEHCPIAPSSPGDWEGRSSGCSPCFLKLRSPISHAPCGPQTGRRRASSVPYTFPRPAPPQSGEGAGSRERGGGGGQTGNLYCFLSWKYF